MSDNAKFAPTPAHSMSAPDITVNARDVFGIDVDMIVPAFSEGSDYGLRGLVWACVGMCGLVWACVGVCVLVRTCVLVESCVFV